MLYTIIFNAPVRKLELAGLSSEVLKALKAQEPELLKKLNSKTEVQVSVSSREFVNFNVDTVLNVERYSKLFRLSDTVSVNVPIPIDFYSYSFRMSYGDYGDVLVIHPELPKFQSAVICFLMGEGSGLEAGFDIVDGELSCVLDWDTYTYNKLKELL